MATTTVHISGHLSTSGSYSYASLSNPDRAYTDADSTTYARIACKTGRNAESYVYFTFDLSSIPSDATNISVTARVKCNISNKSYLTTVTAQLTSGTTKKGTSTDARHTTLTTYDLTPGTWTRSELNDCRLYVYAIRGTSSTTRSVNYDIYGADITVTYTVPTPTYRLYAKNNGSWTEYTRAYKKVSGAWVEQSDLSTIFDPDVKYRRGN